MTSRDQLPEQQSGLGTKPRPNHAAAQRLQPNRSTITTEQGRKAPTGAIDLKRGREFEEQTLTPHSYDIYGVEEDGYGDSWPERLPTSSRRYTAHVGQDDQARAIPRRSKTTVNVRAPAKETRRLKRTRFHPLVFVGIGLFIMIIGWLSFSALSSWYNTWQDDMHYGRPRTYQVDAVVGHGDSAANPSHFIAVNLNGQILVIEVSGGNPSKAQIYIGPRLFGAGSELTPVTVSFEDCDGNGNPDLIIHIQGSDKLICFPNNGKTFVTQQQQH